MREASWTAAATLPPLAANMKGGSGHGQDGADRGYALSCITQTTPCVAVPAKTKWSHLYLLCSRHHSGTELGTQTKMLLDMSNKFEDTGED